MRFLMEMTENQNSRDSASPREKISSLALLRKVLAILIAIPSSWSTGNILAKLISSSPTTSGMEDMKDHQRVLPIH